MKTPRLLLSLTVFLITVAFSLAGTAQSDIPDSSKWSVKRAVESMRDSDKRVRMAALKRLSKEQGKTIQQWIAHAAQFDAEPRIRYQAVIVLHKRREKASIKVLEKMERAEKDPRVLDAVKKALEDARGGKPDTRFEAEPLPKLNLTPPPPPPPDAKAGDLAPGAGPRPPTHELPPKKEPEKKPGPKKDTPAPAKTDTAKPAPAGDAPPPDTQPGASAPAATPPAGTKEEATAPPAEQPPEEPPPPPEKEVTRNEMGHELPPGYEDGWIDQETVVDKKKDKGGHSGFMPMIGFDGAMGTPRDTLTRTSFGGTIGVETGSFSNTFTNTISEGNIERSLQSANDFSFTDFSLNLIGRWAPVEFFEMGIEFEAFTVESLKHDQTWHNYDSTDQTLGDEYPDTELFVDNSPYDSAKYTSPSIGLAALDLKVLFARTEMLRIGLALRGHFPSHIGERFKKGIGAPILYHNELDAPKTITQKGLLWGADAGLIASVAVLDELTVYADIAFLLTILTYEENKNAGSDVQKRKATNMYITPHLGAQYRLLDGDLGIQLALAPTIYLGTTMDAGMPSFGLVPGVLYRVADLVDLSLTASIEIGGDAANPFLCTGEDLLIPPGTDSPNACGVGRRFGIGVGATYDF